MDTNTLAKTGFTGNQLKLIAVITMTIDHMGMILFPRLWVLRLIGRLAMPIYAYMIAEGCRHTHDRRRYLGRIVGLGLLCQVVYTAYLQSLYLNILLTFSLSILLIYAIENFQQKRTLVAQIGVFALLLGILVLTVAMPQLLWRWDFDFDYGLMGVLLPVLVYFGREKTKYLAAGLILLGFHYGGLQWAALAAVPLLGMYNGQRGKGNVGKWFYLYYPAHLLVLYGIGMVIS